MPAFAFATAILAAAAAFAMTGQGGALTTFGSEIAALAFALGAGLATLSLIAIDD